MSASDTMQINAGANVQTIGAQFVAGNNVEINSPKFSALSLLTPTMVLRPSGLVGLFNGRDGWFGYGYDGGLVGSFYGSFAVNADDIQIEGVAVNAALGATYRTTPKTLKVPQGAGPLFTQSVGILGGVLR